MGNIKSYRFPTEISDEMIRAILDDRKTAMRLNPFQVLDQYQLQGMYRDGNSCLCALFLCTGDDENRITNPVYAPYEPGDILWIQEAWRVRNMGGDYARGDRWAEIEYRADGDTKIIHVDSPEFEKYRTGARWTSSIRMTQDMARLFVRVTNVQAERLREITVDGILQEGIDVEIPEICKQSRDPNFPTPEQRAQWEKMTEAQRDEYVQNRARHVYIGWCDYADNLFAAYARQWNSVLPFGSLIGCCWKSNPWVFVTEFERISGEDAAQYSQVKDRAEVL